MSYLVYSTGWAKNYNTLYPFLRVSTIPEAVSYMRELLKEGRAVRVFSKPVNVDQFRVINKGNKRVVRRK
jgi:hypothetical protein